MKIMLINPMFRHVSTVLPPMGLLYLAAVLEKNNFNVKLLDANALKMDNQTVLDKIDEEQPDIVGITIATPMIAGASALAKLIKARHPKTMIMFGGPHPSALPMECLKAGADIVVTGEGEETMLEVCRTPEKKNIPGTVVWKNKKIHANEPRPLIKDLDSIPFPARHLININDYFTVGVVKKPFTTILTSRGCPGHCIYCNKKIFGKTFRARSPENVIQEIEFLIENYGIRELDIMDDTFTLDMKRAEKVCDLIIERGINISWRCPNGIRVDCVSEHLLFKMKKAGCHQVSFGVESGDDRILMQIGKQITTEQVRNAFHMAKKAGLETIGFFMLGLPFDTKETMQKTIDLAIELDPDYAQFTMTMPLPETSLYKWFHQQSNIIKWEELSILEGKAAFGTENFTKHDVEEFYKKAYRSFYKRPSYILKNIAKMRSPTEIKAKLIGLKNIIGFTR